VDYDNSPVIDLLPSMKTDITLHKGPRTLIIDTKYYGTSLQYNQDKASIRSNNLYQIFAYVKNLDKDNTGNVSGMLLYAKTKEEISPDLDAVIGGNKIYVRTLDLNCDFKTIELQLKDITSIIT
jgi:5-methylcytosine-specific restriction enzyme subunit McrC